MEVIARELVGSRREFILLDYDPMTYEYRYSQIINHNAPMYYDMNHIKGYGGCLDYRRTEFDIEEII